jgi:hypothetical protein
MLFLDELLDFSYIVSRDVRDFKRACTALKLRAYPTIEKYAIIS